MNKKNDYLKILRNILLILRTTHLIWKFVIGV